MASFKAAILFLLVACCASSGEARPAVSHIPPDKVLCRTTDPVLKANRPMRCFREPAADRMADTCSTQGSLVFHSLKPAVHACVVARQKRHGLSHDLNFGCT